MKEFIKNRLWLVRDLFLNFNPQMVSFAINRVTGIGLSLYLLLHIYTLSSARGGKEAFYHALEKYDNTFGHTLEYLLLLCVLIHGINGIRIVVADLFGLTRRQSVYLWYVTGVAASIAIFSISVFFHHSH